jgi:hypothetical protein
MTELLSTADVARTLGMSREFVRDHAAELSGIRLGGPRGRLRFEEVHVRAYIEKQRLGEDEDRDIPRSRPRPGPRRTGDVELLPLPKGMR